jgi:uncharacterized membrane protein
MAEILLKKRTSVRRIGMKLAISTDDVALQTRHAVFWEVRAASRAYRFQEDMSDGSPASVIVALYEAAAQAQKVLGTLEPSGAGHGAKVLDAAVMTMDDSSRLQIVAMFAGAESPGKLAAIFPPKIVSSRAIGPAADRAQEHFRALGLQRNLLKEIGENLSPGGAALVAIVEEDWVGRLASAIAGYGDLARYTMEAPG